MSTRPRDAALPSGPCPEDGLSPSSSVSLSRHSSSGAVTASLSRTGGFPEPIITAPAPTAAVYPHPNPPLLSSCERHPGSCSAALAATGLVVRCCHCAIAALQAELLEQSEAARRALARSAALEGEAQMAATEAEMLPRVQAENTLLRAEMEVLTMRVRVSLPQIVATATAMAPPSSPSPSVTVPTVMETTTDTPAITTTSTVVALGGGATAAPPLNTTLTPLPCLTNATIDQLSKTAILASTIDGVHFVIAIPEFAAATATQLSRPFPALGRWWRLAVSFAAERASDGTTRASSSTTKITTPPTAPADRPRPPQVRGSNSTTITTSGSIAYGRVALRLLRDDLYHHQLQSQLQQHSDPTRPPHQDQQEQRDSSNHNGGRSGAAATSGSTGTAASQTPAFFFTIYHPADRSRDLQLPPAAAASSDGLVAATSDRSTAITATTTTPSSAAAATPTGSTTPRVVESLDGCPVGGDGGPLHKSSLTERGFIEADSFLHIGVTLTTAPPPSLPPPTDMMIA